MSYQSQLSSLLLWHFERFSPSKTYIIIIYLTTRHYDFLFWFWEDVVDIMTDAPRLTHALYPGQLPFLFQ